MKSGVGDTLAKAFLGGYNEKREPTFADSLGVILFYVLMMVIYGYFMLANLSTAPKFIYAQF